MSRIMVVEDEALVGLELKETLGRLGYDVPPVVGNADNVIGEVMRHNPDLVLMDIRLKGFTDGIDATQRLRSFTDVPVIYLTACSTPDILGRALRTDPSAYLLKPVDERQLRINIELALRKHRKEGTVDVSAFLSGMLKGLQTPSIVFNDEGTILACNDPAISVIGAGTEIRNRNLKDFIDWNTLRNLKAGDFHPYVWKNGAASRKIHIRREELPPMGQPATSLHLAILENVDPRERKLMENIGKDINNEIFALLPDPFLPRQGIEIAGSLIPSASGSGDIYDIFSPDGRHWLFYMLDVMGHGTLSAFFAIMVRTMIRSLAEAETLHASAGNRPCSPTALLDQVNQQYRRNEGQVPFFTIAMGCLDISNGNLAMVHAGHPSGILVNHSGVHHLKSSSNAAMGVFDQVELHEHRGTLSAGDRILLFSDGFLRRIGGSSDGDVASGLREASQIAAGNQGTDLGLCLQALMIRQNEAKACCPDEDAGVFILEWTGTANG